ncbi:hypothetical protein ENUP19_0331G0018 [Entamoeba nuttalli]|uniref:Palmitoyltransferase n=2 Tax=Entamoeba nuttalli TaxID=412467 RepID=K2H546_ENTNP|nr:DHHC zinc finger domain containing protein [Entamoeba nuttalli P19]EKE41527.1 DHHC zinc finger domain containing protein [Entamoeba nuttalli P19]|eukprot:XP_008856136.1 DHHC zinc finger domain containing protein [Entamoeba nuttalli P19]
MNWSIIFLCICVIALLILTLCLIGQGNGLENNSILGKTYQFLVSDDGLVRYVRLLFGGKQWGMIKSFYNKILYKKSHLLQIIYLAMIGVCDLLLIRDVFHSLPQEYFIFFHINLILTIIFFFIASLSNPGYINQYNVKEYIKKYPFDNIIFYRRKCSTCLLMKPSRSHHCNICNRCIAKYEHHCCWINNCIGELNCRYFIIFLIITTMLCYHSCFLSFSVVSKVITQYDLLNIDSYHLTNEQSLIILFNETGSALFVGLFSLFSGVILSLFTLYHIMMISRGITTNEKFKWKMLQSRDSTIQYKNKYDLGVIENIFCVLVPSRKPQYTFK